LLEWFQYNAERIQNFSTMCMGEVHIDITPYFYWAPTPKMWSRSGNLIREALLKPKVINLKDRWNAIYHEDENRTCGCVEHLYHNVMLPNGDISLCCMDYGLDQILGNLYEKSYESIIPNAMQTYKLCKYCENGVNPTEKPVTFYK